MIMGMSSDIMKGTISAAGSIGSGIIGSIASAIGARKQWQREKEMFQMQNDRQDWLLQNSALMQKKNLQNAGYSTADPNGTGVTAPSVTSMNPVDYVSAYNQIGNHATVAALQAAQVANLNAQTNKVNKETEGQEIQNYLNQTYGAKNWEATIKNLDAQTKQYIEEAAYKAQEKLNSIKMTDASVKNLNERLEMDWAKLPPSLKLLGAQADQITKSAELTEEQKKLVWANVSKAYKDVQKLQSEINLNYAQIEVAQNLAQKYIAEKLNIDENTLYTKAQKWNTMTEAQQKDFELEVAKSMGIPFWHAQKVISAMLPFGALGVAASKMF